MLLPSVLIFLQVCTLQLTVVAMPTCPMEGCLVQTAHHLLRDLGGDFPDHCLKYNANISFPGCASPAGTANHSQCPRALWVVYEWLLEAGNMFESYELPAEEGGVSWDEKTLEDFQNLQYRLLEEGSCLTRVGDSDDLSPYFRNMTSLLQQQESASCGWMALRRDLLKVLMYSLQKHRTCFTWRRPHRH